MDTFGNTGDLRIPSQHTAPGTFVNSAGQGLDRLHAAQTGNNPFFSQQFTGAPQQQTGLGTANAGAFGQQPGRLVPAQTGPAGFGAGPFGQTSNNPFGAQLGSGQGQGVYGQQGQLQHNQQQQQQQSGSLIDL